jgi:putative peptidoglycan lipid II flippase
MAVFRERFLQGLRLILLGLLPATVLLAILARPLIWVVFAQFSSRFTSEHVGPTAATLMALSWGMVGFSVYLYVLRGFTVLKDTKTPFFVNVFENVVNLGLAFAFTSTAGLAWGVEGLGWAWSGAYLIAAVVALGRLRKRIGDFGFETAVATTATVIRMFTATGVMLGAVLVVRMLIPGTEGADAWLNLAAGTAVGLVVYVLALLALGVKEIKELPRTLVRRR